MEIKNDSNRNAHIIFFKTKAHSGLECVSVLTNGVLNRVLEKFLCLIIVSLNLALRAGSSMQGMALRASVG